MRRFYPRVAGLAGMLLAGMAGAAQVGDVPAGLDGAQRPGVPAVLVPPPQPPARALMARDTFRAAYARAGAPRIILFWNRTLTDAVSSSHVDWVAGAVSSRSVGVATEDGVDSAVAGYRETRAIAARGTQRLDEGARAGMDEADDWDVEAAYQAAFLDAGARFVDRAVAIRASAAGQGHGERANAQDIEALALAGKADLLMEVLQTPAPGTPTGYRFRVNVKDVRTGGIVATIVDDGTAIADRPGRMVAVAGGFERERPPAADARSAGRALATRTMLSLADRLR